MNEVENGNITKAIKLYPGADGKSFTKFFD
jgi:hypothetical protein